MEVKNLTPKMKGSLRYLSFVILLAVFFMAGFGFGSDYTSNKKPLDLSKFWKVYDLVNKNYVGSLDKTNAERGAISGLVNSLGDPYSVYLPPEDKKSLDQDLQGQFEGIGAELTDKDGSVVVVAPLSGTPAEKAGIKANDIILKVDDTTTEGMVLNDVINKIRGPKGTTVKITVYRKSSATPIEMTITRETIVVKSVEYKMIGNVGYMQIRQFGDDTTDLVKAAVKDIASKNPKAMIIDLRNNPGGYLNAVAPIAGQFIAPSVVVYEKEKSGSLTDIRSTEVPVLPNTPVYILVNEGSASASEILAGALQDYKRATLVGKKTFGKGSVQDMISLNDGSALKITIAEWLTPNKRAINKIGIEPDVKVDGEKTATTDPVLDKALELIKK